MRRIALILVLILYSLSSFSQVDKPRNLTSFDFKKLHWGFTVGFNTMDFSVKRNPGAEDFVYMDVQGFEPGFQVNIVSDLRLTDNWNLRFLPGINLGSRRMYFYDPETWESLVLKNTNGKEFDYMSTGSSYLDFPLLLKYRSERVNNYRPYVIGGLSYRLDMSAKNSYDIDKADRFLLKKSDYYLEMGFGIDSYLQYFKFSTEIKLAIGLRNVLVTDNPFDGQEYYTNSILGLRSYLLMINFHFE